MKQTPPRPANPDEGARAAELSAAFQRAQAWVQTQRYNSATNGFGKGGEWGDHVVQHFMPPWFQRWIQAAKWHPVGLLGSEAEWWDYVRAFGLTPEQWWAAVDRANKPHKGARSQPKI